MKNMVVFIKLNSSAPTVQGAINYVKDSYQRQVKHFYYTSGADTQVIQDLLVSLDASDLLNRSIVFIEYRKTSEVFIKKLYVGYICGLEQEGESYQIFYRITNEVISPLVIDNFMMFSNLNIDRDFQEDSHISIEDSAALCKQLFYAINTPRNTAPRTMVYAANESEAGLSEFAQRNEYCTRFYNVLPATEGRCEFQRDYDRIVHSKAFRRMVDKAQIFTSSKGDHYRTRMTHTLCVTQIARSIATRLQMNVALTEAIALGHDLGHTPFGHQGERTLNSAAQPHGIVGFKHNYQSLNVASVLEEEYIECAGLDLSTQVLEGMWKHTKIRKGTGTPLLCDLTDYLPSDISEDAIQALHPEQNFCSTIEGQIVFIADEIAQRSHDLDDALSAGLLSIDGLLETLSLIKLHALKDEIERLKHSIDDARQNNRVFVSANELLVSRISSRVINYFIDDVVREHSSTLRSEALQSSLRTYFQQNKSVDRQLISFSEQGSILNNYLETIVTKQVINSAEVAAFDDKAQRIVSSLFDLYYKNPRLLHDGTLQRIYIRMRKKTPNVIHFQDGDISLVNDEWARIKNPQMAPRLRDLREGFPDVDFHAYRSFTEYWNSLTPGSAEYLAVNDYVSGCVTEYTEKKKILVRSICDFISGMTDTYAINEYRKLLY